MTVSNFSVPPKDLEDQRKLGRLQSNAIEGLLNGRTNNVLDVQLTASAGTTTVNDARIGVNTVAVCIPTNANSSAIALPYRDITAPVNGIMTLVHGNDANADKIFKVILVG